MTFITAFDLYKKTSKATIKTLSVLLMKEEISIATDLSTLGYTSISHDTTPSIWTNTIRTTVPEVYPVLIQRVSHLMLLHKIPIQDHLGIIDSAGMILSETPTDDEFIYGSLITGVPTEELREKHR